jgi:hypothetical protein
MTPALEASPASVSQRRKARRVLFVGVTLVLVVGLLELAGGLAWWISTGECFTWGRAALARQQALAASGGEVRPAPGTPSDDKEQRAARHGVMVHPYLGFVRGSNHRGIVPDTVSALGFFGESPIRKRSKDRYIVGVLGGSVALMFALYGEQGLLASLERSPKLAGRKIEIVNLALGGYKQPQQLMALQLMRVLGGEFDCILNIDGFNEVALVSENVPLGVPGWYPRSWARLLDSQPSPEQSLRIGRIAVLKEDRGAGARAGDTLWWSPLAQFVWRWRDRDILAQLTALRQEAERAMPGDNPAIRGPGTEGRSVLQASDDMVLLWQRASRQLHALCEQNGIRYYHFLQPNQYVPNSKPMGAAERALAFDPEHEWRPLVASRFPKLQIAGRELRAEGVQFTDLTNIFASHPEPLYTDTCCHFNRLGNTILASHIAAAIRADLDLSEVELQRILVVPDRIKVPSPLARVPVYVLGEDAAGARYEISGAGFGTEITANPAGNVAIGVDGSIRAKRRGRTTLRVRYEGMEATVKVSATWPNFVEGADAIPSADNQTPLLMLDREAVARGDKTLTVVCSNLPEAPMRMAVISPSPLPSSVLDANAMEMTLRPIMADGATATVMMPAVIPAGQPLFLRCYCLDETLKTIVAASNTVVITRD